MRQDKSGEKFSIDLVLRKLNSVLETSFSLILQPDVHNRISEDVDGVAECERNPPLAIEHTRLESIKAQQQSSAWFEQAFIPLVDDMKEIMPNGCALEIDYVNVKRGQDWKAIRGELKKWLTELAANLRPGRVECDAGNIPFFVAFSFTPQLTTPFRVVRRTPPGKIESHLLESMNRALGHKYERLGEYQTDGMGTVLILQSHDIALVNSAMIYKAFLLSTNCTPRPFLDQVWFVYGERAEIDLCCFRGPPKLLAAVNRPNYRFGPQFEAEWMC